MSEIFDVTALPIAVSGILPRGVRQGRKPRPGVLGGQQGREGNVLVFAQVGGKAVVETGRISGVSTDMMTVEVWINTSVQTNQTVLVLDAPQQPPLFTRAASLAITISGNRVAVSVLGNPPFVQSNDTRTIADGTWHHLAVVFDNPAVEIYKDGISTRETFSISDSVVTAGDVVIGTGFMGTIFDVRLWAGALSGAQIQAGRYASLTGSEAGLVLGLALNRLTSETINIAQPTAGPGPLTSCTVAWQPLPSPASVAMSLAGGDQYVDVGSVNGVTSNAATFECWLQLSTAAGVSALQQTILLVNGDGQSVAPRFSYEGGDRLGLYWIDAGMASGNTTVISDGAWHHVAAVSDQGTVTFYVDGVSLVGTGQFAAVHSAATDLQVGAGVGSAAALQGLLTGVRVWAVARSAAEISSFRFIQLTGHEPGLVALCDLAGADPADPTTMVPIDRVTGKAGSVDNGAKVVIAAPPPQPTPTAVWSFSLTGAAPTGPLLSTQSVLCADNVTATSTALLHSVDLQKPTPATWTYNPASQSRFATNVIPAVVAVTDGKAFVGVQAANGAAGSIELHAVNTSDGSPSWPNPTDIVGGHFLTRPVVYQGKVLIGVNAADGDAVLGMFDTETGIGSVHDFGNINLPNFMADPLPVGATVYTAVASATSSSVYAIPFSETGLLTWVTNLPGITGDLGSGPGVIFVPAGGNLYCLDAATGDQVWSQPHHLSSSPVTGAPIVIGNVVYVGSTDGVLYAMDIATGAEKWRLNTQGPITTGLVNEDGILYFANQGDGVDIPPSFLAVDTNSLGADALTYAVPQADTITFAQAAGNGVVYFYGAQTVYAVNMSTVVREFDITTKLIVEDYDTTAASGNVLPSGNNTSYRVTIMIRDEYGSPRIRQPLKVTAGGTLYVLNQADPLTLTANQPVWMETDGSGELTLAVSAFDNGTPAGNPNMTCPPLYLWASFMSLEENVMVFPDDEQLTALASVQGTTPTGAKRRSFATSGSASALDVAQGYDGQKLILAMYQDPNSLSAIASTVRNTMGAPGNTPSGPAGLATARRHRKYVTTSTRANVVYLPAGSDPVTTRTYRSGAVPTFTADFSSGLPTFAAGTFDVARPKTLANGRITPIGGIISDISHFVANVVKGAERVAKMAWRATEDAVTTVIHTAENVYNLTITCLEDAVLAVTGFMKSVVADIRKVIQWLSALFDWENILVNHTYLKQRISNPSDSANPGALDQLGSWLKTTAPTDVTMIFSGWLNPGPASANASLTRTVAAQHGQTIGIQQAGNNDPNSAYNYGGPAAAPQNNSTQCTWMKQKLSENSAGGSTGPSVLRRTATGRPQSADALQTFLGEVEAQLTTTFSDLPAQIQAAVDSLVGDFSNPKAMVSAGTGAIMGVFQTLLQDLLQFGQALALDFLELLVNLLSELTTLINTTIQIPFISSLYKRLTNDDLTFLDLFCLIGAIPGTILLDVITGSPKLPGTPTGRAAATTSIDPTVAVFISGCVFAMNAVVIAVDTESLTQSVAGVSSNFFSRMDVACEIVNWGSNLAVSLLNASPVGQLQAHDWVFQAAQSIPIVINVGYLFDGATVRNQTERDAALGAALLILASIYADQFPNSYRDAPKAPGLVISANIFGGLCSMVEAFVREGDPEGSAFALGGKLLFGVVSAVLAFSGNLRSAQS